MRVEGGLLSGVAGSNAAVTVFDVTITVPGPEIQGDIAFLLGDIAFLLGGSYSVASAEAGPGRGFSTDFDDRRAGRGQLDSKLSMAYLEDFRLDWLPCARRCDFPSTQCNA